MYLVDVFANGSTMYRVYGVQRIAVRDALRRQCCSERSSESSPCPCAQVDPLVGSQVVHDESDKSEGQYKTEMQALKVPSR